MATGDISSVAIASTGSQVSLQIEGFAAAGVTGFESGKSATVTCTSEGYSGIVLGTKSRNNVRTKFNSATSSGGLLINDTFTEASDISLASHSPDTNTPGNAWVERNGSWIVNGTVDAALGSGTSPGGQGWLATIDSGISDGTIQATVRLMNGFTSAGVIFRYTDNNNFWMAVVGDQVDRVRIVKVESGVATDVETADISIGTATSYTIQVVLSGQNITANIAGQALSTSSAFNQSATSHGLRAVTTGNRLEDFRVTATTNAIVTLDLEEPIHSADTNISIVIDASAFHDGNNLSQAYSGTPTNNSTLAYPETVSLIVSKPVQKHTGSFDVYVYGCAGAYEGQFAQFGVSAVAVTVTDISSFTQTKTVTEMSLVNAAGSNGYQSQFTIFKVTFNTSDRGDGSPFTTGVATITASVYPKVGNAASVRTSPSIRVYLDPANSYDTHEAWVSTTGNDNTGSVGSSATPFLTMRAAANALAAASTNSTASFSTIYLTEGNHTFGGAATPSCPTPDGPLIVTRANGTSKSNVKITASGGLGTACYELRDVTIQPASGDYLLDLGSVTSGIGPDGTAKHFINMLSVDFVGSGRDTANYFGVLYSGSGVISSWAGDCHITQTNYGIMAAIEESCRFSEVAGDAQQSGSGNRALINCDVSLHVNVAAYPPGESPHADVFQFFYKLSPDAGTENCVIHNNLVHDYLEAQMAPFGAGAAATQYVESVGITNNVQEDESGTTIAQLGSGIWRSLFLYHNDFGDTLLLRNDSGDFSLSNTFVHRNVFAAISYQSNPTVYDAGWVDNHFISAVNTKGFDITTGGSLATLFVDWSNDNYEPANTLLNRGWSELLTSYDASGTSIPTDGSGAIGALQISNTDSVGPGFLSSPFRFS